MNIDFQQDLVIATFPELSVEGVKANGEPFKAVVKEASLKVTIEDAKEDTVRTLEGVLGKHFDSSQWTIVVETE